MRKVLITGGSGQVGSNLAFGLAQDFDVCSLYNRHQTNFAGCYNIKLDLTKREEVLKLVSLQPEIIVHCAALTSFADCETNPGLAKLLNVEVTVNILELVKQSKAKLIYLSTDAVFKGDRGDYKENDFPDATSLYGKTKAEGEKVCLNYENSLVLRINIFGKSYAQEKRNFIGNLLASLEKGESYGAFTDAYFTPLYIKYLTESIRKLINSDAKGIFHVTGSEKLSKYAFAKEVAKIFGYNEDLIKKSVVGNRIYPRDISLKNNKLLGLINLKIPNVNEMINEFKQELEIRTQKSI